MNVVWTGVMLVGLGLLTINNVDMALKIDNASYHAHRLKSRIYQDMYQRKVFHQFYYINL